MATDADDPSNRDAEPRGDQTDPSFSVAPPPRRGPPPLPPRSSAAPEGEDSRKLPARLGRSVLPTAPGWKPKTPTEMRASRPPPPAPRAARSLKSTVRLKPDRSAAPTQPGIPRAGGMPLQQTPSAPPRPASATRPSAPPPAPTQPAPTALRPSSFPRPPAPTTDQVSNAAVLARLRSLELDGAEHRKKLEALGQRVETLRTATDRPVAASNEVAGLKERIAALEARSADASRLQLQLDALDERVDTLEGEDSPQPDATALPTAEELLSLDARLGAVETALGERHTSRLDGRVEAAEAAVADLQRALAETHNALHHREQAFEVLKAELAEHMRQQSSTRASSAAAPPRPPGSREAAATPTGLPLTAVKGIGPKLGGKLSEVGLRDAAELAALDDADLDSLSTQSGVKLGHLQRLRSAALELVG